MSWKNKLNFTSPIADCGRLSNNQIDATSLMVLTGHNSYRSAFTCLRSESNAIIISLPSCVGLKALAKRQKQLQEKQDTPATLLASVTPAAAGSRNR
jgi:hypothetical protein